MITYKQRELWLIFDFKKKQWYEKKLRKKLKVNFLKMFKHCAVLLLSPLYFCLLRRKVLTPYA